MKTALRSVNLVAAMLLLSACAGQLSQQSNRFVAQLEETQLYVKGTFNWWGVNEAFRFTALPNQSNSWYVDINLIDDGSRYDFKITDANWSASQTCGAVDQKTLIEAGERIKLFCQSDSQNIQYLPQGDGMYRFTISKDSSSVYSLKIDKR
jgi:hypothetical protein